MNLKQYNAKRNFKQTPEPSGGRRKGKQLTFVIQRHNASHLHYDFRLEMEGVLKSWAVPKGPSLNPNDKRLAMMVEDHPLDYGGFKGIIPEGNYGAGTVEIWDKGNYEPLLNTNGSAEKELLRELDKGDLKFILHGKKLNGAFALVRMHTGDNKSWLLIKKKDAFAVNKNYNIENVKPLIPLNKKELQSEMYKKKNTPSNKNLVKKKPEPEQAKRLEFSTALKKLNSPMLAKYVDAPFNDKDRIFEYKFDGYRTIAGINKGKVSLFSRNKLSLNHRFPAIVESLEIIKDSVIIDGEVVAEDKKGKHAFQLLQNFQTTGEGRLVYYVFDLLYLNGHELISMELNQRKELLELLFKKYKFKDVRLSEFITGKGISLFNKARKKGMEGIVAKEWSGIYEPGRRSSTWLKIKAFLQQEAVICGFTEPRGSRKKFGALIVGVFKNGRLTYAGHCGTGFDEALLNEVYNRLKPLIQNKCPFETIPQTNEKPTWVKPELVCNIKFSEITTDGQFRVPVFLGLRIDKKPQEVKMEIPQKIK